MPEGEDDVFPLGKLSFHRVHPDEIDLGGLGDKLHVSLVEEREEAGEKLLAEKLPQDDTEFHSIIKG